MKFFKSDHLSKKIIWLCVVSFVILGLVASGAYAKQPQTSAVKKIESSTSSSSQSATTTTTTIQISQVANSTPASGASLLGPVNRIQIGSTLIGYRQFGTGPNLILLNDSGESMDSWGISLLTQLSSSYKVLILDYPGVGYSTDNTSVPMTINWIGSKIIKLVAYLKLSNINIVGQGFGGEVALEIAESQPKLVNGLILVATSPGSPASNLTPSNLSQLLFSTTATYVQKYQALFPSTAQSDLTNFLTPSNQLPIEPILNSTLIRQNQAQSDYISSNKVIDSLSVIKAKCLVLVGDKDTIMPEQDSNLLISGLSNATKKVLTGFGHALMQQNPAVFIQNLTSFLN